MAALRALFIFAGLTGIHSISTVSKVSVKTGGSISVPCSYESKYTNHVKYLCQGYRWASCEYIVQTNQPRGSGRYSISDDKQKKIFTVTIDPVTNSDSCYWCNVEINNAGDDGRMFQLSVTEGRPQLSVDHQKVTGFIGEDVTIRFTNSIKRAIQWCTLGGPCVREPGGSIDGTRVTITVIRPDAFTVTLSGLRTEGDSWYYCAHGDVQMPVHVTVKEKPTTRIHSISTVSKVSVKTGGSISVPCSYESKYTNHVKYLCQGYRWASCEYIVQTNQPRGSGRFSISDDKQKKIFTVTIDPVTNSDSYYWCNVEINNAGDDGRRFQLSVTKGRPQLSVDHQKVTGFIGEDVTIRFTNSIKRAIQWCTLGGSCVREPGGSIDGTRVTIKVIRPDVFTVTLSGLRTEGDSWYYCAHGDVQMPVHVTVKKKPTTSTLTPTYHVNTLTATLQPVNPTYVLGHEEHTTVQTESHSSSLDLRHFSIRLSVLVLIVLVSLLVLFIFKRQKRTTAESSAIMSPEGDVTFSFEEQQEKLNKPEVTYIPDGTK